MKIKALIALALVGLLSFTVSSAKENKKAATYKTHEVSTGSTTVADKDAPVVYFTRDISADGLLRVYKAMGWKPSGKVGVKISTGEPPASNYLRPSLIGKLVKDELHGTIVECNTAYGGSRASNAMHKQVAKDHGFLEIADFDLLDEEGYMTLPISGGLRLKEDYVGSHFKNYDSYLVLSHFKGHAMAGFGGAIKNLSIGFGSGQGNKVSGKVWIHSGGMRTKGSIWGDQLPFLEAMADAAKGVCNAMNGGKNIAFVNVMNRLSVDCDCDGHPSEPDMHDIGILASLDPLAIDQASIDLIYSAKDSGSMIDRIESRQGLHTLDSAEKIGLGKRNYRLVEIK